MTDRDEPLRPKVVIVGGGFGGMCAAQALARAPVDILLIDRRNHHLFQPLLYEVATAALSPGEIAVPLRHVFRKQANVSVMLGEVRQVDLEKRHVVVDEDRFPFDYLVLATGSYHHYFGNEEWSRHAPGLKTIDDALDIRRRFLLAFERADRCDDPIERTKWMTTVIVGGGPTGIELAGTMSEVASRVLCGQFRNLDTASLRIVLAEGSDRLLRAMPPDLSERAKRDLEQLGVEVRLDTLVTQVDDDGVVLKNGETIAASNVFWAAGVRGEPVEAGLVDFLERDQRMRVEPDLSLSGHSHVFAIGDLAHVEGVPGLAPAAMQMGTYVGRLIRNEVRSKTTERAPFAYKDKGTMATIGRGKAVAHIGRLRFGGVLAWLFWVFVHILFLIGFRNRFMVLVEWGYAYLTFHRGARLITGELGDSPETTARESADLEAAYRSKK